MKFFFYILRFFTVPAYRIRGIGLGRLCEFIRRWSANYAPDAPLLIKDFRENAKFRCFLKEHMGGQIFFRGSYSGDQLILLEKLLKADSVFLDIGANQGEFSIAAARVVVQGRVIAFEPVSEYRERLLENIKINDFRNIKIVPVALGEQDGELPIFDAPKLFHDGTKNEGLPTLFMSEFRCYPREVVPVRTLDHVVTGLDISQITLIKLDIEGAEWIALRGAVDTLKKYRPILILELGRETCQSAGYEPEALVAWLNNLGYKIEKITDGGKTIPINSIEDFQNVIAYPV